MLALLIMGTERSETKVNCKRYCVVVWVDRSVKDTATPKLWGPFCGGGVPEIRPVPGSMVNAASLFAVSYGKPLALNCAPFSLALFVTT